LSIIDLPWSVIDRYLPERLRSGKRLCAFAVKSFCSVFYLLFSNIMYINSSSCKSFNPENLDSDNKNQQKTFFQLI